MWLLWDFKGIRFCQRWVQYYQYHSISISTYPSRAGNNLGPTISTSSMVEGPSEFSKTCVGQQKCNQALVRRRAKEFISYRLKPFEAVSRWVLSFHKNSWIDLRPITSTRIFWHSKKCKTKDAELVLAGSVQCSSALWQLSKAKQMRDLWVVVKGKRLMDRRHFWNRKWWIFLVNTGLSTQWPGDRAVDRSQGMILMEPSKLSFDPVWRN